MLPPPLLTIKEVEEDDLTPEFYGRILSHFDPPGPKARKFGAFLRCGEAQVLSGYLEYFEVQPGIFILGSLCVDPKVYRALGKEQRAEISRDCSSVARFLVAQSLKILGRKRAVFALARRSWRKRLRSPEYADMGFVLANVARKSPGLGPLTAAFLRTAAQQSSAAGIPFDVYVRA